MGNSKKKMNKTDDSGLSKNHSKDVKYRIRIQEEHEAEQEIKEYEQSESGVDEVHQQHSRDTKPFL